MFFLFFGLTRFTSHRKQDVTWFYCKAISGFLGGFQIMGSKDGLYTLALKHISISISGVVLKSKSPNHIKSYLSGGKNYG